MAQRIRPKQKTPAQASQQAIALKGSTRTVVEFFEFGLSSILYQRNLYPADDFKMVKKFGLNMLMPNDEALQKYLRSITSQLQTWLNAKQVSRLVLAIISKESRETLERWQFEITLEKEGDVADDKENVAENKSKAKKEELTEKQIRDQIQQMIKHICASNAFLPILEEPCTFNVLAYTANDLEVPETWQDSDARLIKGGAVEQVKLRGFSTNVHKVDALVAYKLGEEA